jgi:hypothetical protein
MLHIHYNSLNLELWLDVLSNVVIEWQNLIWYEESPKLAETYFNKSLAVDRNAPAPSITTDIRGVLISAIMMTNREPILNIILSYF